MDYNLSKSDKSKIYTAIRQHQIKLLDDKDILLYLYIGGSRLYGYNTKFSDIDVRGIFIPKLRDWLFGDIRKLHITVNADFLGTHSYTKVDIVLHDIRRYLQIITKCNPNVLESLFIPDDHILFCSNKLQLHTIRKHVVDYRCAKESFLGFAKSQMHQFDNNGKVKGLIHLHRLLDEYDQFCTNGVITYPSRNLELLVQLQNATKEHLRAIDHWRYIKDVGARLTPQQCDMHPNPIVTEQLLTEYLSYAMLTQ